MGECFITRRGGSGALFAVIAVTYPEGSVCTCGGKKAKDTSGYALFNVKAGTYTVECHTSDNSKSKSTSVTVTESDTGKTKSVTLSYDLYLYHEGNECTPVTGGWVKKPYSNGTGTLSKGSSYMTLDCPQGQPTLAIGLGNGGLSLSTINKYKTLSARLRCTKKYGTYTSLRICITNTYSYGESGIDNTIVAKSIIGNPVIGEYLQVDVDITNVSYGRVAILASSGAYEVSDVWLSK